MAPATRANPDKTSAQEDPLEKAEATKEAGSTSAPDGQIKGEKAVDAAIDEASGDASGIDAEKTTEEDDPLEKAEATKESK